MLLLFYALAICAIVWIMINTLCTCLEGNSRLCLFYLITGIAVVIWVTWVTVEVIL
mgnify:CR=1 FL=1